MCLLEMDLKWGWGNRNRERWEESLGSWWGMGFLKKIITWFFDWMGKWKDGAMLLSFILKSFVSRLVDVKLNLKFKIN